MTDETAKVAEQPQGAASDIITLIKHATRWRTYLIYGLLAVIVAEGAVIVWQRGSVAKAELAVADKDAEMTRIKLERDLANTNEKSCRVNLDEQNGRISDAGKRYDRIQKEMAELADRLAKMDVYKDANDVRNQQTPKSCQEALDFMNRNFP